jgi:hypothetical protein
VLPRIDTEGHALQDAAGEPGRRPEPELVRP